MSSSSSYSDSSSDVDSSSEELDSVAVGDFAPARFSSSRRAFILLDTGLGPRLVPFHLLDTGFIFAGLGGRPTLVEIRAGVKVPKREVNKQS